MADFQDRRQTPRIKVNGRLSAEEVGSNRKVQVVDVSLGGFMVSSSEPFGIGLEFEFRFKARDDGWTTVLRARVAYSHRRLTPLGQPSQFASGFAFVNVGDPSVDYSIHGLLSRLTGVLTFPGYP